MFFGERFLFCFAICLDHSISMSLEVFLLVLFEELTVDVDQGLGNLVWVEPLRHARVAI